MRKLIVIAVLALSGVATFAGSAGAANPTTTARLSVGAPSVIAPAQVSVKHLGYNLSAHIASSTAPASGWSDAQTFTPGNPFESVSCAPGTTFCLAVGDNASDEIYNGSWSGGQYNNFNGDFTTVSCVSSSFCAAIYGASPVTDPPNGPMYAAIYTGTWMSWLPPTPPTGGLDVGITTVSCVSASWCMWKSDGAGLPNTAYYQTSNGSSWSQPVNLALGGFALSCPTTSFCMSVGEGGYTDTYTNGSWSSAIDPSTRYAPAMLPAIDNGGGLNSVSCTSSSFCAAVDGSGNALTYNGSSWSAPTLVAPDTAAGAGLTSVSCPAANFCVAVGDFGEESTYNGSSWSTPITIDPQVDGISDNRLMSVSCASVSFCAAVGADGNAFTYAPPATPPPPPVKPPVKPPVFKVPPTIKGSAKVQGELNVSVTVPGTKPSSWKYQWLLCNKSAQKCRAIIGARSTRIKVKKAYAGHRIETVVTATNSAGKVTVTTKPTPVVKR